MPSLRLIAILSAAFISLCGLGRAASPSDGVISFNEVMYHPATGDAGEWVELHNMMGVSVDLSGWRLEGGIAFTFPDGTVMTGGADLVVAKTPGSIAGALGPFTGTLSNNGDTVRIVNNSGRIMDTLTYSDHGDWPVAADGSGVSLAKRDPFLATGTASSWTTSTQVGGTPGAVNFPPPPPPITTRMIDLGSTWKYNNSGAAAGRGVEDGGLRGAGLEQRAGGVQVWQRVSFTRMRRSPPQGGVWNVRAHGRATRTRGFPRRKVTRTKSA